MQKENYYYVLKNISILLEKKRTVHTKFNNYNTNLTKYFLKFINNKNPSFPKKPFDPKKSEVINISEKEPHDINTK